MKTVNEYMRLALLEAKKAFEKGEVPVGAIVVDKDGNVIGFSGNTRESCCDISGHAEMNAIKMAEKKLGRWDLSGCALFVTLEPCLMCAGAIMQCRLSQIYFGARDKDEGAIVSKYSVFDEKKGHDKPLVFGGVEEDECKKILDAFFLRLRS